MQQKQYSRKQLSTRALRAALGGTVAAFALSAGFLALAPQAAHAQAASGVTFTPLHAFAGTDGSDPYGSLLLGSDGNYYGTTFSGGVNNAGTVYKITPSGTLTTIYSFAGGSDGAGPDAALIVGPDGNFYSTTDEGGANSDGTVFKITPSGTETVLYTFSGDTDGANSESALVLGSDGDFYGTAANGGANGDGTVFKLTPSGTETTLYSFSGTDGDEPYWALVQGSDGNFYGTTSYGGANSDGTVFKITPSGTLTTLYSFSGTDGQTPYCSLTPGTDGNFYGTTANGGTNSDGTIFKITASGTLTTLYSFSATDGNGDNADGAGPSQSVILGTDGNFYGVTDYGGANDTGTIFQITPSGTLTTLYTFSADGSSNTDGAYADFDVLTEGPDGTLYGVSNEGGGTDDGTVFKLTVPSLTASIAPAGPSVTGSGVRFDYNGDGKTDILWFNTSSSQLSIFDMNDQSIVSLGNTFAGPAPGSGWQPVASVDVNGDGFPDLIWWNSQTGELSDWTLQGNKLLQAYGDFATVTDTDWKPVAAADVLDNTAGHPTQWELVFQNTATGAISRWVMSGTNVTAYGGTLSTLGAGSPWQIVGAPDLNGDGKSDLLFWNNSTGEVSYWGMNLPNSQVLNVNPAFAACTDTDWHLIGSEDTNGDGHSDLVWWNASTGELSRWLLNGTTVEQYGGDTLKVSDTTWQPTAMR